MKKSIVFIVLGLLWTINIHAQKEGPEKKQDARAIEKGGGGGGGFSPMLDVDNNDRGININADNTAVGLNTATYAGYFTNTKSDNSTVYGLYSYTYNDEDTNPALSYAGYFNNNSLGSADAYAGYFTGNYSSSVPVGYGIYASSSSAQVNWAGYFASGNVYMQNQLGIGIVPSTAKVEIDATGSSQGLRVSGSTSYPIRAEWNGSSLGSAIVGINSGSAGDAIQAINNGTGRSALYASAGSSVDYAIYATGGQNYFQESLGIGITTPGMKIHVKQDISNRAIRTEHQTDTDYWDTGIGLSTKNYKFFYNGLSRADIASADGAYIQTSDRSLKKNISYLKQVLPKVLKLTPAMYHYTDAKSTTPKSLGFIAQEVETVFPELVREREDGSKALAYSDFAILGIQAIQEQQAIIEQQQETINSVKAENTELKERLTRLEAAVEALSQK